MGSIRWNAMRGDGSHFLVQGIIPIFFLSAALSSASSSSTAYTFDDGLKLSSSFNALPPPCEEKRRLLAVMSEQGKAAHAQHVLRVQNALAQALVAICACGIAADGDVEEGE